MYLVFFIHFIVSSAITWIAVKISNFITDVFRVDASSQPPGDITFNDQLSLFTTSAVGIVITFLIVNLLTIGMLKLIQEIKIFKKIKRYLLSAHLFLFVIFLIFIYNHIFNYSAF